MHEVRPVDDNQLPAGVRWAYAMVGGDAYLFVARSEFANPQGVCELLSEAWEAWRTVGRPVPLRPRPWSTPALQAV